eukprot:3449207-Alexandrium_andersonii.AAC.1
MSVVERWIEGRHARINKFLRAEPHHGPEHVAWSCISESIEARLEAAPGDLELLGQHCQSCRTSAAALRMVGMASHPA